MRTSSASKRGASAKPETGAVASKVFKFRGAKIRVVPKDGKLWWMLTDVCNALKSPHPASAAAAVQGVSRVKFKVGKLVNFIETSDLVKFLSESKKPLAAKLKEWASGKRLAPGAGEDAPSQAGKPGAKPASGPRDFEGALLRLLEMEKERKKLAEELQLKTEAIAKLREAFAL